MNPVEAVRTALEAAATRFTSSAEALLEAEAEQQVAAEELRRLESAYRALTGETPATERVAEKITAAPLPQEPTAPRGGICMACEAPQVFPTQREMRGVMVTINSCQACGCDNLL